MQKHFEAGFAGTFEQVRSTEVKHFVMADGMTDQAYQCQQATAMLGTVIDIQVAYLLSVMAHSTIVFINQRL